MLAKISMAFSVLLACAVGYLFYTTSGKKSGSNDEGNEPIVAPAFSGDSVRATVVAFVNGDSLNAQYEFIVEKSKDLEAKMKAAESRVKSAYGSRQAKFDEMMQYAQSHQDMPESEAMALQQEMSALQAEMDGIQEREVGGLKKQEVQLQEELLARVNKYLTTYSKEKGIDYVINKQSEFQVLLYGNSGYDITSEVLAGLNAEYRAEKEKK